MKKGTDQLADLAVRVSDGFQVDWDAAESGLSTGERKVAVGLRHVANVADGYRNLPAMEGEERPLNWGPLEMMEAIGSGAFSRVYRARDPQLDREVALKLHRNRAAASVVIQEARRLSRIRHPNVLTVYGADLVDGQPGIWTELIRGETLAQIIKNQGLMGEGEALHVGLEMCRALAAVHGAGILHRDVKAQNVMREQGGRLVLMDFGAGLPADQEGSGTTSGTPLYMAPELFLDQPATIQSDLYSLGVLLFYLLTASFPVTGDSIKELREAHQEGRRKHLQDRRPDASHRFVQVVNRAIDPNPACRYTSAGEMAKALAESVKKPGRAEPDTSRRLLWRVFIVVAVLAVMATAAVLIRWIPATGSYSVDASLHKLTPQGPATLLNGDAVRPGDRLFLDFKGSRSLYVYILNRDDRGQAYLLFPLPGQDVSNPLPSDDPIRLPGTRHGAEVFWQVTSAGGREHFYLIASPQALTKFENQLAVLDRAEVGRDVSAIPLSGEALGTLRGIGGLVSAAAGSKTQVADVFQQALSLAAASDTTTGVWVRKIELANP